MTKEPRPYIYEFSQMLVLELRHVFEQTNAGELDAKVAFAAWQRALDEEVEDEAFRSFAAENFSLIMAAIAQGQDDVMLIRDITGEVFLRVAGHEMEIRP